ncbi:MAG: hypothetical protein JRH20_18645 [Deltaproteobacteria bacterium]|nr:hypothetical protein [Deltaproteobacteria bacterium]
MTQDIGFKIQSLVLCGPGVPDASVQFTTGLNVVVGPSDTGKTFIAQCINFMFGGSKPPKRIPEAERYDSVLLSLSLAGDDAILRRALNGGAFTLTRGDETITLADSHSAGKADTVSHCLLSFSGLAEKKVRTNSRGTTRRLSFRDISRLILVDEESVIAERSPVFTGQYTKPTEEAGVFRILLTGRDDAAVVEHDEPKVAKSKLEGQKELIANLMQKNSDEISQLGIDTEAEPADAALEAAEAEIERISLALAEERASVSQLEDSRRDAWTSLQQLESRAAIVKELHSRFELLQRQYQSDLRRLGAVGEAGARLAQMTEERCPVCGAPSEHHDRTHQRQHSAPEEVSDACRAEAKKLQILLLDLEKTINENVAESKNIEVERTQARQRLEEVQAHIAQEVGPRVTSLLAALATTRQHRDPLAKCVDLQAQRAELARLLAEANKPAPKAPKLPSPNVGADQAARFCEAAENLLRAFNFPNADRVSFSEEDQDLVIGERKRMSHGKGVRALTHAAFTLALLRYCRSEGRPHPGIAIIDSPLVVYREPDADERGAYDVKDAFYRCVAEQFASDQILIFENEDPPEGISANIITFTGSDSGRRGFIPS